MKGKQLVIIPVFNEEATLTAVLQELRAHYGGDILVIDDGSSDRSMEKARAHSGPGLSIIAHVRNEGYGASLIEGFNYAVSHRYEVAVTMDCDAQHEPHQVPELFNSLADADVLSGSRYLKESERNDQAPQDRMRINRAITARVCSITGYKLTDAFCGFKAYRVSAVAKLDLSEKGYAFPLQFWVQAARHGLRVKEIPVARIYGNLNRSFGAELDNPEKRLHYYEEILEREAAKWKTA